MKKFLVGIVSAMLAVLLCFSLAGCDKSADVQKAFEDKGYKVTVVDTNNSSAKGVLSLVLTEEQMEKADEYGIYLCTKDIIKVAVFIKFSSDSELKDFLTVEKDGNKDTSLYDKAKETGLINGNCYLVSTASEYLEIFKNA